MRNFNLVGKKNSLTIQQFKSGKYITPYNFLKLNLYGLPFKVGKVSVDNEDIDIKNIDLSLLVSKDFTTIHIVGE